jgi:hypothetical protein
MACLIASRDRGGQLLSISDSAAARAAGPRQESADFCEAVDNLCMYIVVLDIEMLTSSTHDDDEGVAKTDTRNCGAGRLPV